MTTQQDELVTLDMTMITPGGQQIDLQGESNAEGTRCYLAYFMDSFLLGNLSPDGESMTMEGRVYSRDEARAWVRGA